MKQTNKQSKQIKQSSNSNLRDYISELFNATALGIQYWRKHKTHKCYNCGKYGHIAEHCHLICPMCANLHNNTVCVHSLVKIYKKIEEILKRNIVIDEQKLILKIEKAKLDVSKSDTEAIIGQCRKNLNYNTCNSIQHYWTIEYKAQMPTYIKYDYNYLKPTAVQRFEVKRTQQQIIEFQNDIILGLVQPPSNKSIVISPQHNYIFKPFDFKFNEQRVYNKYKPVIVAKLNTMQSINNQIIDFNNQIDADKKLLLEAQHKISLYEHDELIKSGRVQGEYKCSTGWFYNPSKCKQAIEVEINKIKTNINTLRTQIINKTKTRECLTSEKLTLEKAMANEINVKFARPILHKTMGVFSCHMGNNLKQDYNPYKDTLKMIQDYKNTLNHYLEKLSHVKTDKEDMKITSAQVQKTHKELEKVTKKLKNANETEQKMYDKIRRKADVKIQQQYDKLHQKQQDFYNMKDEHYALLKQRTDKFFRKKNEFYKKKDDFYKNLKNGYGMNKYKQFTRNKLKRMGNIIRHLNSRNSALRKKNDANYKTWTVKIKKYGIIEPVYYYNVSNRYLEKLRERFETDDNTQSFTYY